MNFCLEAERFVDDRLSNWYIRRNRRRFWKSEKRRGQRRCISNAIYSFDDTDKIVRTDHAVYSRVNAPESLRGKQETAKHSSLRLS